MFAIKNSIARVVQVSQHHMLCLLLISCGSVLFGAPLDWPSAHQLYRIVNP